MRRLAILVAALAGLLVAAAPAAASPYADAVLATPGLAAYWRLGEGAGTVAADATAAWPGTLATVALGVEGALAADADTAARFAGSGSVAAGAGPVPGAAFTVEAWVNPDAARLGYLVSDGTATTGYHLSLNSSGAPVVLVGMTGGTVSVAGPVLSLRAWHHVAATVDATAVTLYVDGAAVGSSAARGTPRNGAGTLMVARYSASARDWLRGALDEVALYGAALPPATVRAHHDLAVDAMPPATTVLDAPPADASARDAAFTFAATKAAVTFECRRDGGAWAACTSPATYTALSDGAHTFSVRARDRWGAVEAAPPERAWTVDTAAPATGTVAILPSGAQPTGALAFSSPDAGARFECRTDTGPWAPCTSPLATAGGHTFSVRAVDAAGNADPTPATVRIPVASAPSLAELVGPSASFPLWWDEVMAVTCRLDDGPWSPCPATVMATPVLAPGPHTLAVRAQVAADASQTVQVAWTAGQPLDVVAPATSAMAILPSASQPAATVAFASPDPTARFECRTDDGAWSGCASPARGPGGHRFAVRAVDPAGNADATPSELAVPPPAPPDAIALTGVRETFGVWADGGAGTECAIDGGAWSVCHGRVSTGTLGPGAHGVAVRAALPGVGMRTVQTGWSVALAAPRLVGVQFPALVSLPPARKISARFPVSRLPALRFALSVPATVRIAVVRASGRRRGRELAAWTIAGAAGANVARMPLATYRRLTTARYRLTVQATGAAGAAAPRTEHFYAVRR